MRPTLGLLLSLLLTGCASSRPPGTLPPPGTLAEVNEQLFDVRATVFMEDGTQRIGYVQVEPVQTSFWSERGTLVTRGHRSERVFDPRRRVVLATDSISRIEIDDSVTRAQGAGSGFLFGLLPGAAMGALGLVAWVSDPPPCESDYSCAAGPVLTIGGAVVGVLGGAVSAAVGASEAAPRYPVTIYEAPVTRYPDAALALVEREPAAAASR